MPLHRGVTATRILCIEDEPDLLEDLVIELSDEGYSVTSAADGLAGLAALRESAFDLVLCDVRMPGLTGVELVERARAELPAETMPRFMFLTAYGDPQMQRDAWRLGVLELVIKPVDYAYLRARVHHALGSDA